MIKNIDLEKHGRLVAGGLLFVAIALVFSVTILPIWRTNAVHQATLDDLYHKLESYSRISERDAALLPRYRAERSAQLSAGNYLKSGTPAVAGAELQRRVKEIADSNNVQVISTRILPSSDEDGFIRVSLNIRMRGALPSMLQSIYELETDDVFMFVQRLTLQENTLNRRARASEALPMDAEFELAAYMPDIS